MVPSVASTPTWRVFVRLPITSAVGLITPSTRRSGSIFGRSICWMERSAFAEAVLQPSITRWQPISKSFTTAWRVNSYTTSNERGP